MFAVVTVRACKVEVEIVPFILGRDVPFLELSFSSRMVVNCTELVLFEVESSILSSIVVVGSCSNEV